MKVKDYLHFLPNRPLDITNSPRLYFHRGRCPTTIRSIRNYQYDEWKGSGKDDKDLKEKEKQKETHGSDCIRYLCMANPTFDGMANLRKEEPSMAESPY